MSTSPMSSPAGNPADQRTDPAVEFLTQLLPVESPVRKRAFSALLRALVTERTSR